MGVGRPDPFDRESMGLSILVHLLAFSLLWAPPLHDSPDVTYLSYEIELVSPPPSARAEESRPAVAQLEVERPDEEPGVEASEVDEVADPTESLPPRNESTPRTGATPVEVADTASEAASSVEPPEEEIDVTGEDLLIRMEGLRRDYPEYNARIIRAIRDCFRWGRGGRWETTVDFFIERDGSVSSAVEFVVRSGNVAFDFEAMGAVDCAGRGRVGPLPEGFPFDRFPVRFTFRPEGMAVG